MAQQTSPLVGDLMDTIEDIRGLIPDGAFLRLINLTTELRALLPVSIESANTHLRRGRNTDYPADVRRLHLRHAAAMYKMLIPPGQFLGQMLFVIAQRQNSVDDYTAARENLRLAESWSDGPPRGSVRLVMGITLSLLGAHKDALQCYQSAIADFAATPQFYQAGHANYNAGLKCLQLNRPDDALAHFIRAGEIYAVAFGPAHDETIIAQRKIERVRQMLVERPAIHLQQ